MPDYSILLIEDDDKTRSRLARAIREYPGLSVLADVGTCAEARAVLDEQQPKVMLTDLGLPDGDGIELIREIYQRGYSTDVMVISVFGDEKHVVSAIEAGATGYILKDGTTEYIGDSVMQLLNGGSPISAPIARYLLNRFHKTEGEQVAVGVEVPSLTEREREVLSHLTKGYSFQEIADLLSISPHTVTSHVKHIYRKLAVRSRSEAVFEALQLGLIHMDEH